MPLLMVLGVALALAAPAAAQAAAPPLSLTRADQSATREADATVADWRDVYEEDMALPPRPDDPIEGEWYAGDLGYDPVYIAAYDLDPCDRVSRRMAECDITYRLSDGDACDDVIEVRATRRGRAIASETGMECDSSATP